MGDFENIKSRPFKRGDKNEANCISDYGTGVRGRFVYRNGKFINIADYKETKRQVHAVHQDTMDGIEHPAEPGKLIESRSQFRAITKKHGLEEIGNEKLKPREPVRKESSEEDYINAVKKAINDCRWGNSGLSEYEREKCRRIDRLRNNHG